MQVTQERLKASKEFSELAGLVFWSVIRENGLDPATGFKIDFSDLPVFSDAAPTYASGDNVVSWDDHWVLTLEPGGMPYIGRRSGDGWIRNGVDVSNLVERIKAKEAGDGELLRNQQGVEAWKSKLTTSGFIVKSLTSWWWLCTTTARLLLKKR
jgi:hypothetical protein